MPIPTDNNAGGIISPSPIAATPEPVNSIRVTKEEYKDIALDTRWTPFAAIMSHVAGAAWTVDYYSQVVDTDSQLMSQAPTVSPVFQQYKLIKELVLRVSSPLNQVQDQETKMMQIDGSAIVHSFMIPNEGDMFVADIGVGKPAVFRVTNTKKNSIFKEATYEIEYAMASTHEEYIHDLERKVVNTYVYRQDFQSRGQEPIVLEEESATIDELMLVYDRLAKSYFPTFYNKEYATFTIPFQAHSIYDPFLTKFLSAQFSKEDSIVLQKVRVLNLGDDAACAQNSFWDAFSCRDLAMLKSGFTKTGLIWCNQFERNPFFNGIRWSGIEQCIYPTNPRIGVGGLGAFQPKTLTSDQLVSVSPYTFYTDGEAGPTSDQIGHNKAFPDPNTAVTITGLNPDGTLDFPGVATDAYYVLSHNFYAQTTTQSVIEELVSRFIKHEAIDPVQLKKNAELVHEWGVLEQFYYIPILMYIIRNFVNGFSE